jgi:hypothetical protein
MGTKLILKHARERGVGVVVGSEGRHVDVFFPDVMERARLTPDPGAIELIVVGEGDEVYVPNDPERGVAVVVSVGGGVAALSDGSTHALADLWPVLARRSPLARLLAGERGGHAHLINRADAFQLGDLRHRGALANLVGGRIELFAHQLDTARRALERAPVRWLMADEVGLGKTIVAHMITSSMLRGGRIERVVVVAPETLTIQWLGELYRKFHQVFVRVDEERLGDVALEVGPEANPFDVYPLSVVGLELLGRDPSVSDALAACPPDLIVFDEAHRLLEGDAGARLLELAREVEHALMLTATPFQLGVPGFLGLVDALGLEHVAAPNGRHIVKGVSAVTRRDIPELPARAPASVAVDAFDPARAFTAQDPRVIWIAETLRALKAERKKALIFVEDDRRAGQLMETLERMTHIDLYAFTDALSPEERDIALSRFRLSSSPALVSSGAGSEGRNFQFCDVLINLELPADPTVLAQRIGRLDRIGRERDIPIFTFVGEALGEQHDLARAYDEVGVLSDAAVGASPALGVLRAFFADREGSGLTLDEAIARTRERLERHEGAWLFPSSHDPDDRDAVFEELPDDLELLVERFTLAAAERVGMDVVEKDGLSTYYVEHGASVVVDTIPGVPRDARHLGTFDREEAVADLDLEFFTIGHPLVEGLLAELEDSEEGRAGGASLSWRRLAREFGLEGLGGDAYLLLVSRDARGAYTPTLHGLGAEGAIEERSPEEARGVLLALEHSQPLEAARAPSLGAWAGAIEEAGLDHEGVAMAALVSWER